MIVTLDTGPALAVRRFRDHWSKLSGPSLGRPPVNAEIKAPVARMAEANPL
ncbi:MAG: hypothetical protein ACREKS_01535 [Candidatus Rokuibacteriota bacterium]